MTIFVVIMFQLKNVPCDARMNDNTAVPVVPDILFFRKHVVNALMQFYSIEQISIFFKNKM